MGICVCVSVICVRCVHMHVSVEGGVLHMCMSVCDCVYITLYAHVCCISVGVYMMCLYKRVSMGI